MNSPWRYRIFISYAHADAPIARAVQKRLETYRPPKGMAVDSPRLGPVFLDRNELPAAPHLTVTLRDALASSERLLVICTPRSAQSGYVAQEVELFTQLRGRDHVLLYVADGVPPACFPESLRSGDEPLAADAREVGDGPELALLKIISALYGLPSVDELFQRDARRRKRRSAVIAAAAVAGAAVLSAAAILTWRSDRQSGGSCPDFCAPVTLL